MAQNTNSLRGAGLSLLILILLPAIIYAHDPPAGGVSIASCGRKRSVDGSYSAMAASGCVLAPEMTEGPYYWEDLLLRSNVTEGRPGIPLSLELTVVDVNTCEPVPGAIVDIWHCDATGLYSHYTSAGSSGMASTTDNTTFLRGIQVSNTEGKVTFASLYPGFYQGRTTHIHVKVHLNTSVVHTGQLFFNDSLCDAIYQLSPYNQNSASRTLLASDGIYTGTTDANSGLFEYVHYVDPSNGYSGGLIAPLTLAIDPAATGNDGDIGMPGGGGGGRPGGPRGSPTSSPAADDDGEADEGGSVLSSVIILGFSLTAFSAIIGGLLFLKIRKDREGYESL